MSRKSLELLLTENVESLGIVGDVVRVKAGFARNYLLPHGYATIPTERAKAALAERRAQVQAQLARLRNEMETLMDELEGFEITIERSCNDHGFLYGSVTQGDIAEALAEAGYPQIHDRHIRLGSAIKRIDSYNVPVQVDHDLRTEIKLWVVADRELHLDEDEPAEQLEGEGESEESAESGTPAPAATE